MPSVGSKRVIVWQLRCSERVRVRVQSVNVGVGLARWAGEVGRRERLLICSNALPLLQPDIHTYTQVIPLCPVGSGSA